MTKLQIKASIKRGDYGMDYAVVCIGDTVIYVYESTVCPGGIAIDIDTGSEALLVTVDDMPWGAGA